VKLIHFGEIATLKLIHFLQQSPILDVHSSGSGGRREVIEINLYEQIRYLYAVEKLSKRD
jgi:hypothetical protein